MCRVRRIDIKTEMQKFHDYISAYFDSPEPWIKPGEKRKPSALPMSLRLAWALMERMSEDEAWNCPMARAMAYYTALAEYNGQDFMTEDEAAKVGAI